MIHMLSDHRSVTAKSSQQRRNKSHKNTLRQDGDDNEREHKEPTRRQDERHAEFERKIKCKAEIAATTQKQEMIKSFTISDQAEGVVDIGVAALPNRNKDTNAEATEEMRSGRIVVESEHEEVRLEVEAASALHLTGDALAGSTESEQLEDLLRKPQPPKQHSIWIPK